VPRPKRAYNAEERRALLLRRGELSALAQHPSWPVLAVVGQEKAERIKNSIAIKVIGSGMTLEQQAYWRGFLHGMNYMLVVPTNADARLEELLREQPDEEVTSG
jgi:hypothetical protein